MPDEESYRFELQFDAERNMVRAFHAGLCTLPLLKAFLDAIVNDPRWAAGMMLLSDFRQTDASHLSNDDMREYAAHTARYFDRIAGSKAATVADKPLNFGMVRVWEAFAAIRETPIEHRVFQTLEEAERWLGVPPKK
ncbi:MAG: hypothetical protein IH626_18675 [Rhodospirillales bacterium]|nr:hypothetical protein [Rhodospirillales bacterium]